MAQRLVFTGKQQVALETIDVGTPEADQVIVATRVTLMSTGTENIVFNQLMETGTHWHNWAGDRFPFYPGYSAVGTITAVGSGVTTLKVGDRVASRYGHASHARRKASECVPLPNGLDDEAAAWFALAKIAAMGARVADLRLGRSVLVIGAGPVGQMILRWCAAAGAEPLAMLDLAASRLDMARRGGATHTLAISATSPDADAAVRAVFGGELPDVVVDSTGHPAVFAAALKLVAPRGQLLLLGDTGTPSLQHLTSDVITRGLRIVGAHDLHETPDWDLARITRLFGHLAVSGRFDLSGMTTHRFTPAQCVDAYRIVNAERDRTMGVVFDWR